MGPLSKTLYAVRAGIAASAVLLGAGLAGPCMVVVPAFGRYDGWVQLLKPSLARPTDARPTGPFDAPALGKPLGSP